MSRFSAVLRYYFNLGLGRDSEAATIASIKRNISFRGVNLWTLIFAIIIASVGLNVNSTAVIIGAMLISPLMGPIMGVGLGVAIFDFELVRKGVKNLAVAMVISIATSTLYFYLTPLHNPTPEILARTTPTIWDVFIAFAGGLAGVIGATRKEKGNVIPGVAIATALMPPLCTAGFGLANGYWFYFLGALYLFFINSVFICIATVLILRFMDFHRSVITDEGRRRRVTQYILMTVIVTIIPSIWLAYRIVLRAIFESNAEQYVRKEFNFVQTQVVSKNFVFDSRKPKLELLLIGQVLDSASIGKLENKLPKYNLSGTNLIIRQGLDARQEIDFAQVRASILEEVFSRGDTANQVEDNSPGQVLQPDITGEIRALFPQIRSYALSKAAIVQTDSIGKADSAMLFIAGIHTSIRQADQRRLQAWLQARLLPDSVQVIYRRVR